MHLFLQIINSVYSLFCLQDSVDSATLASLTQVNLNHKNHNFHFSFYENCELTRNKQYFQL